MLSWANNPLNTNKQNLADLNATNRALPCHEVLKVYCKKQVEQICEQGSICPSEIGCCFSTSTEKHFSKTFSQTQFHNFDASYHITAR